MDDRYKLHSGNSYSVQCEVCRRIFDVVIRTKDGIDLCFQCYKNRFGEDDLNRAMQTMTDEMKKSGWNSIESDTLIVGKQLLDNAYELFLAKKKLKTVFDRMPQLPSSQEEIMEAGSLLMTARELTFEQINEIKERMKDDPMSIQKFKEICESENQYLLKQNYELCPRCNLRPLNKPRQSRTESNKTICNVCSTNEVLTDLSNRPEMSLQDYDDFFDSNSNDLPSRNFEFTHRIFQEEKTKGTPEDLIENIMRQRVHDLERHPTDSKGWCTYCEMFFRASLIPEKIRSHLESCPNCINIVSRQAITNEQIAITLRKHIKKQHKDIYKIITTPNSDYFQWDFITPENDERRRHAQWMAFHPDGNPEDYEKERMQYIKRHHLMSRSKEPVQEDPNQVFPSMDNMEKRSPATNNHVMYNMARNWVERLFKGSKDIEHDLKMKGGSDKWINSLKNRIKTMNEEHKVGLIADLMEHFKSVIEGKILPERSTPENLSAQMLKCERCRELGNSQESNTMSQEEVDKQFRSHIIEVHPEFCLFISNGTDNNFSTSFSYKSNQIESLISHEILLEFYKSIKNVKIDFQTDEGRENFKDVLSKSGDKIIKNYPDLTKEQIRKISIMANDSIHNALYKQMERTPLIRNPKVVEFEKNLTKTYNRNTKELIKEYDVSAEQVEEIRKLVKQYVPFKSGYTKHEFCEKVKCINDKYGKKIQGTQKREYKPRKIFVKYEEFKKFLKDKNIKSIRDFIKFVEINKIPDSIPKLPKSAESYYRKQGVWNGWSSACGIKRKEAMTRERIDEILDHILENFDAFMSLSDALLLYWFDSFGLFGTKDPLKNAFFKNFIEWKDQEHGRKALYEWLTDRDFEKEHYGFTLVQKKDETREQFLSRQYASTKPKKEQLFRTTTESVDDILHSSKTFDPVDYKKNPKLFSIFVDFVVDRLMMSYIDNQTQQFNIKKNGQKFNDTVIDRFKDMKKIIKNLDFKQKEYKGLEPTLLQCYGVYKARKKLGFLNMFGTGTGKTKIGFMLAKHIGAKRVFWVSPYNVVNQTNEMCMTDYPDSITTSVLDDKKNKRIPDSYINGQTSQKKTRFHFINYEKFNNKTNGKNLINQLSDTKIDLIILDEGQRVKSRKDESNVTERTSKSSNTRQNVLELVRQLRKKNPNMKVLVLTATPIINSIREAMSIYEILTSSTLNMSGANNIKNGMRMYVELLPYSVRFEQKYDIDIIQKPIVCEGFLPDSMSEETGQKLSWLEIEQIATKYRIPLMLEEAKRIMKEDPNAKILIYTDLKTGIIDQLVEVFGEHNEFKVGIFSGDDKTGMVKDLGFVDGKRKFFNPFVMGDVNVLIATRSIAVGIDGIQSVCNHIFFNGLVWTWADFEQIRGRLVRTGQAKDKVYVSMFFSTINGYPYDLNLKYKRIIRKKGLGELVRDGRLPKDIDTGVTKQEKKEFIETCFKNRISGFPTKEELELKHAEIAQQQIETEVEELEEEFPEIDIGGFKDE